MGILPIAKTLGQIAPRYAGTVAIEPRFDETTIVVGGDTDMPLRPGSKSLIRSH
jgi:hypothetical protein